MKEPKIVITNLSDAAASFYEDDERKNFFRPIAHLSLGYGVENCKDSEADFCETVAFCNEAAKEVDAKVFVLGLCPRSITSTWLKAAELIIKGSDVRIVVIPMARVVRADHRNPIVTGTILFVDKTGLFNVVSMGEVTAEEFRLKYTEEALYFHRECLKEDYAEAP